VIVPAAQSTPFVARHDIRCLIIADPETVPPRVDQRIDVPGLDTRRADVPLIARQILLEWTLTEAKSLARHIDERGEPKLSIELVRHLLAVELPQNERTLRHILWESVETSPQSRLAPPAAASNVRAAAWEMEFPDD
jgi:DNA-binding NtrC family response regulator